jgi:hypothetical protein
MKRLLITLWLLPACEEAIKIDTSPITEDGELLSDNDADGYLSDEDCDDSDPAINPGSEEICDGIDNDCDNQADEDVTDSFYADADQDGFGNNDISTLACEVPSGFVSNGSDCDDTDPTSYPSAEEVCDGVDNDCNGEIDEEIGQDFFIDDDQDGFGDETQLVEACDLQVGLSAIGGDCDDGNPSVYPTSEEICDETDNNCNGDVDEGVAELFYADFDEDGHGDPDTTSEACSAPEGYLEDASDCDDTDTLVHPGADEYCDGADNDCDGTVDEDFSADALLFYEDNDGDGYGNPESILSACAQPDGYVSDSSDCEDNSNHIHPFATETCNALDDDCNGLIDEEGASGAFTYYADYDGDGFGDATTPNESCTQPSDHTTNDGDCDDNDDDISPDGTEYCDELDNDCDGEVDEDSDDANLWYADVDGDGLGDASTEMPSCSVPAGYVENGDDCDDLNEDTLGASTHYWDNDGDGYGDTSITTESCLPTLGYVTNDSDCDDSDDDISPDGTEYCDEIDNDCDGETDEGSSDALLWFLDLDADGYGDTASTVYACEQPDGHVSIGGDCDVHDDDVNPYQSEVCNGEDDDCDGAEDEDDSLDAILHYADLDSDGFGDPETGSTACSVPDGSVLNGEDCNDALSDISPDSAEICDDIDNDCNGLVDDASTDTTIWYSDSDNDGFGSIETAEASCGALDGYVENAEDCDDNDDDINPSALELCDGIDNNCDGNTDEDSAADAAIWYLDRDIDGFGDSLNSMASCTQPVDHVSVLGDCDDLDNDVNPAATEYCNGEDDDCSGAADEGDSLDATLWFFDGDNDGYGLAGTEVSACDAPDGHVGNADDCNDDDSALGLNSTEVCDGIDNDCDGEVDGENAEDRSTWYLDADGDGYGLEGSEVEACTLPPGYSDNRDDCNDEDDSLALITTEVCDGADNDCDGIIDGGTAIGATTWFLDADEDGYGLSSSTVAACDEPDGYTDNGDDCNDEDGTLALVSTEICDELDNDCDGVVDGAEAVDSSTWYIDADDDGYGVDSSTMEACVKPEGYSDNSDDCNDEDDSLILAEIEICDGLDNDCDGLVDEDTVEGIEELCPATSCESILAEDPTALDGTYYIEGLEGSTVEAYCEMDFEDGGWLAVYNMMERAQTNSEATNMHSSLIVNEDMEAAVLPDTTSTAIYTSNIDLSQYSSVLYGWAASADEDVSHWGTYTTSSLEGECYIDGYCGENVAIATFNIEPTGNSRTIYTGNSPSYPHVGLGFSGQIIVWGFDNNGTSYSHWANWYDNNDCCEAGNDSTMTASGWRYVIYLR